MEGTTESDCKSEAGGTKLGDTLLRATPFICWMLSNTSELQKAITIARSNKAESNIS